MTHLLIADHGSTDSSVCSNRLTARFKAAWREFLMQRRLNATVYTLQALDDRTLSDIGLDRSEIEAVVGAKGDERRQRMIDLGGVVARG